MAGIGTGFAALSMGKKVGIAVGTVIVILVLVVAIIRGVNAHDRALVQQGRDQVDAEWAAETQKLKDQAQASATKADDKAAAKLEEARQQAAEDRKAVEDAAANNTSALDALFGG